MSRAIAQVLIAMSLCVVGCSEDRLGQPMVLESVDEAPRWTVDINRVLNGIYRTYRPRCIDTVRVGHTVEFRNFSPDIPANVTGITVPSAALPLYSPNLTTLYNYVGRDDPDNDLCETLAADQSCAVRPHWSYWRYTFTTPGVYDWLDTNSGTPGRQVVDAYYGTVTFVGFDPNSPFGTVCVQDEAGQGCDNVCCRTDDDCAGGQQCFATDASGRCLTPSGG